MKLEEELRDTKQRLSCMEEQMAQMETSQTQTCEKQRISRLEEQLALLMQAQVATPSLNSEKICSYANKPLPSVGSQPTMRRNDKEKSVVNEMSQPLSNNGLGKGKPCHLAMGIKSNIVATGMVFASNESDLLHNVPIGKGKLRVAIEVAIVPKVPLPEPIEHEEVFLVEDAVGYHVAWPNIIASKNSVSFKKSNNKK